MIGHSGIANYKVGYPDDEKRDSSKCIKVDHEECKCNDPEADCMEKERKVTSNKIEIPLERLHISKLAYIHIENVHLDRTAYNVKEREAEGPHRNAEYGDLVFKSVCDAVNIH